jgi:voltage-gated potassium channel
MTFRRRVWTQLDLNAWPSEGVSPLNRLILALVITSVLVSLLQTEATLERASDWFLMAEVAGGVLFSVEFIARLWCKVENPDFADRFGRVRYFFEWHSVIDLVAVLSIWIDVAGHGEGWVVALRFARISRIFWLSSHSAVGQAVHELWSAVRDRATELFLAAVVAWIVMLVSSIGLYMAERTAQPEAFGSIPRAMWWAVTTMTTVGYGDVVPVTVMGKVLGGLTALTSIAILALPAGILAAAFSDAFQRTRARRKAKGPDA